MSGRDISSGMTAPDHGWHPLSELCANCGNELGNHDDDDEFTPSGTWR